MRLVAALLALGACWSATGCQSGMVRPAPPSIARSTAHRPNPAGRSSRPSADPMPPVPESAATELAVANDQAPVAPEPGDDLPPSDVTLAAYQAEEIASPEPVAGVAGAARAPQAGDPDQFVKPLSDVPLDIRPTQGEMPFDAAAQAFAATNANPNWDTRTRRPVVVDYTPWTICFRPLYFEEIGLERYGCSAGVFQPFISYSHFLTTVPLMPYRMVVRCPRSCVCSNGASQCGDPLLPGYTTSGIRLDAAAIEAGIIAGIVIALP
jgi:hypothetical protein